MKTSNPYKGAKAALVSFALTVIILLPGCKTGDLEEQIATLSDSQTLLLEERDSLQNLLKNTNHQLDVTSAGYQDLKEDLKDLNDKNSSLISGYNSKSRELLKANKANADISTAIVQQETRNDSLQKEIAALVNRIATVDRQMAESQQEKADLEEAIREQEEKVLADSIAEAETIADLQVEEEIKETRYINITEVGGDFGLGSVTRDYSKSFFSFTNISGCVIDKNFMMGIGAGVHVYSEGVLIPLFLDFRYTLNENKLTPYFVADGGLLINPSDFTGGTKLFINPGIGAKYTFTKKVAITFGGGLLIQSGDGRDSFVNVKLGFICKL